MHRGDQQSLVINFVVPNLDESTWRCVGWEQLENHMGPNTWPLVYMTPRAYLRLVDPGFGPRSSEFSRSSMAWLQAAARKGDCFAPLLADPNSGRERGILSVHNGRHRAWLAAKLGMKEVPVYVR